METGAKSWLVCITIATGVGLWAGCRGSDLLAPPEGSLDVTVDTRGLEIDADGYLLAIDGAGGYGIDTNETVTIPDVAAGEHAVQLTGIAGNCKVGGSALRIVIVPRDGAAQARFDVVCTPLTALTAVSDQDQMGRAGRVLEEPLVVRVSDLDGKPVPGAMVEWTTSPGDGALGGDTVADLSVAMVRTRSDADGLARASVMPLWLGAIEVVARRVDSVGSWAAVRFRIDASDPGARLTAVSGDAQLAKPGRRLEQPLVVQLTDGRGDVIPHVDVIWTVNGGYGDFGPIGVNESLAWWFAVRTDADGRAQAVPIPRWFGPISIEARSLNLVDPVVFTADASDPGATVSIVSGNGQEGRAGKPLDEPLVIRVTDGAGQAVPDFAVLWVAMDDPESSWWVFGKATRWATDSDGYSRTAFTPVTAGTNWVTVEAPGIEREARFEAEVDVVVIDYMASEGGTFADPSCLVFGSCDQAESLPLGATVEWMNHLSSARLVSTSLPPGGTWFDSGQLKEGERFRFAPNVAGTWEYTDVIQGRTGTLYVY